MNTSEVIKVTIIFALLTIAGVGMAVGSANLVDAHSQQVLVSLGSALFGGALAFFLVQMFALDHRAKE